MRVNIQKPPTFEAINPITTQNMNKKAVFILALLPLLYACTETIFTGRKALNLISIDAMNQLSFAEYQTDLTENKPME